MSTELVERLLDESQRLSGHSLDRGSVDAGIASNLAAEAADELTALTAKVAEAEQRIAALMSERSSLIATKAQQLVALTKRATAAEAAVKKEQEAWMDIERANRELFDGAVEDILKIKALTAKVALLTEALEWYGEKALLARMIHSGGDPARYALSDDGGKRARRALSEPDKGET